MRTQISACKIDNTKTLFTATAETPIEVCVKLNDLRDWAKINRAQLMATLVQEDGQVLSIRIGSGT